MAKKYGTVLGTRLGKIPEDLWVMPRSIFTMSLIKKNCVYASLLVPSRLVVGLASSMPQHELSRLELIPNYICAVRLCCYKCLMWKHLY